MALVRFDTEGGIGLARERVNLLVDAIRVYCEQANSQTLEVLRFLGETAISEFPRGSGSF